MSEDGQYARFEAGSVQLFLSSLTKNVDPRRENVYYDEEMERERMKVVSLSSFPDIE
jgi:hypothetical protein